MEKVKAGQRRQQRQKGKKGHVQGCVSQKGDGSNGSVEGMLAACSLGAVAKAAEVWCGWQKAK